MVDKTPPLEMYEFITKTGIDMDLEFVKEGLISSKGGLYSSYRTLAVLEWHLHKDKEKFKEHLKTALAYERERFTEAHAANPNIWYHCSGGYSDTALMTGDFAYAQQYSTFLDDHLHPKPDALEPWGYYITMYLILGRYEDILDFNMAKLKKSYERKMYEKIRPEYGLYEALVNKDTASFHSHLEQLAKTHKGTGNLFVNYEDRLLCVTGLALTNLALGRGMNIDFDHPFVPKALMGA
jgi:hypothetical protein